MIAMYDMLVRLPDWAAFCYDKGIKSGSMRTATPHESFSYTPAFAKTDDRGKKKFETRDRG